MCGIAGIVSRPPSPPQEQRVATMTRALVHRGPDGRGLVVEGQAALGHTRLAILDPSGGAQPMRGDGAGTWIVYNGEIYNSPRLRAELSRSRSFRTTCDTEVLVKGYEEWGEGVIDRIEGMFAFAIWDGRRRRLLLARDRLGIKPLVYSETPVGIVFASEISALLRSGLVTFGIDPDSLRDFLELGYVPAPWTILSAVRRLPPGHLALFQDGCLTLRRYWSPSMVITEGDDGGRRRASLQATEARSVSAASSSHGQSQSAGPRKDVGTSALAEEWDERFRVVVDGHRLSDVPIGGLLSGGIDSSLVASALSGGAAGPVPVYTLGFDEEAWDETAYARQIADTLGASFHTERIGREVQDRIPAILASLPEPFGDPSLIPTWLVSRLAARDVKVVLSGDGGDELFAGYTRYQGERLSGLLGRLPASALRPLATSLRKSSEWLAPGASVPLRRLARVLDEAVLPLGARYHSKSRVPGGSLASELITHKEGVAPTGRCQDLLLEILDRTRQVADPVLRLSLLDLEFYLPNDMLLKVDMASMAHSLEVRVPFLDHTLVELALSFPSSVKLRGMTTKWLLRRLAARVLPAGFAKRPKRGFGAPVSTWMRGRPGVVLEEWLRGSGSGPVRSAILPGHALGLLEAHRRRDADHGPLLYNLLALAAWECSREDREAAPASE